MSGTQRVACRSSRVTPIAGAGAFVAWLVAAYLYSLCVPIEFGCHRGDAAACADLARVLRLAAAFGALGLVLAVVAAVAFTRARRRGSTRSR
jgi:hypothetical protein